MSTVEKPVRSRRANNAVAKRVHINLTAADVDRLASVMGLVERGTGAPVTMARVFSVSLALLQHRLRHDGERSALWLFRV